MPLSFLNKNNQTLALLVDIGSASVGVSLVIVEEGKGPHLLITSREDIAFQGSLSSSRFLIAMNNALGKALNDLQQKRNKLNQSSSEKFTNPNIFSKSIGTPEHIFCTLSSPWFILKNRPLSIVHDGAFDVTERVISNLVDSDLARLKEELEKTLPMGDVKVIEKKIIQTKLDGVEVSDLINKKASRIELSMMVGVSSGKVIESIERKLGHYFHSTRIHFGTFPVATFSAIRDMFPLEERFAFIDITGEATDVSLAEHDSLVKTLSFPYGVNFFIREISAELNTVHEEAVSLFAMFLRGELNRAQHTQIATIVARAESDWNEHLKNAFTKILNGNEIPHKVFFITDTEVVPTFLSLIITVVSKVTDKSIPDIQYLGPFITKNAITFGVESDKDPFLGIEASLAQKIIPQHK